MTMGPKQMYLLIGGTHDGQRREISDEPDEIRITWPAALGLNPTSLERAMVTPQAMTVVTKDTYRRTAFSTTPEQQLTVYAHETMSVDDVLAALIENYRPRP